MADQLRAVLQLPGAFMRWWLGELAGLMPRLFRPSRAKPKASLILSCRDDEIALIEQGRRGGDQELGRISRRDFDHLPPDGIDRPASLAALERRRYGSWPLILRLEPHLGMRKMVDLPLAARDDLAQLLHFELDRLTPFKPEDVVFAWRIEEQDKKAGRMRVRLEMAPRTLIDRVADLARRYRRKIDRIELGGTGPDQRPLDLSPRQAEGARGGGWLNRVLRLAAIVLLVIAVMMPLRKQAAVIEDLEADIATARAEAEESLTLRETLAFKSDETGFLAEMRNRRPPMTELLAELTTLLPDHSHILQLRVADDTIELMGLAEKATDLIGILDRSPMLARPTFSSPVTRDSRSEKERFHISVELAARAT